ncbi:MAG: GDSL-type esterase/lipase family protein [Prevotellaceae bacterium]|jgi:lysophospholipase L1-like esterase|nr:GDSL-type esterase/lipase family protein [Prevotellaceae bacterium]
MENISRRQFITKTGWAGVASLAAPALILPGAQKAQAAQASPRIVEANPEPVAGQRFVFQGDSITDGGWGVICGADYRNTWNPNCLGQSYVFSIASRIAADFPKAGMAFFNRGIAGDSMWNLQARWQRDALNLNPDVLSVLTGANNIIIMGDSNAGDSPCVFTTKLMDVLSQSKEKNPNLKIVLGIPFIFPVGNYISKWNTFSQVGEAYADAVRDAAIQIDAIVVDYKQLFDDATTEDTPITYWTEDGIHPTCAGHELMAREWIKQVAEELPFLKKYQY